MSDFFTITVNKEIIYNLSFRYCLSFHAFRHFISVGSRLGPMSCRIQWYYAYNQGFIPESSENQNKLQILKKKNFFFNNTSFRGRWIRIKWFPFDQDYHFPETTELLNLPGNYYFLIFVIYKTSIFLRSLYPNFIVSVWSRLWFSRKGINPEITIHLNYLYFKQSLGLRKLIPNLLFLRNSDYYFREIPQ